MQRHHVQVEKVDLRELKIAHEKGDGKFKLDIPRYQRGLVWTQKQKEALLESISLGYPIGSLLAFQTSHKNFKGSAPVIWELVDGLQRASTLIEYMDHPFTVAGMASFVDDEDLINLSQVIYSSPTHDQIERIGFLVESWLRTTRKPEPNFGFSNVKLLQYLKSSITDSEKFSDNANDLEIAGYLGDNLLKKITDKIDLIASSQLPIIVYTGSAKNVPEIFERINSQGIKLSKYETYAATWNSIGTTITNQDIRDAISAKYAKLTEAGFEISGINDLAIGNENYNLFEYLFGLGKLLAEEHPLLFPESSEPDELAPSAFVMTTIAYGLKTSQMSRLAYTLQEKNNGGNIDLSSFESALKVACTDIEKKLSKHLKIKLNSNSDGKRFLPHSENQIYSLIVRYLIEKFDPEHNWALRSNSQSLALLSNIPIFYLLDVLNGEWAGSGDTRLWNMVWSILDDETLVPSSYYLSKPNKPSCELILDTWHDKELQKLQVKRTNISSDSKLLMKYLYSDIVTVADDQDLKFHIEHLWPVKTLTDLIKQQNGNEGWPISALGNLSILTNSVNTKKSDTMLGDYKLVAPESEVSANQWQRIQEWLIYPKIEEIKFRNSLTREDFIKFCSLRFKAIRDRVLMQLGY